MKRAFDFVLAIFASCILVVPIIFVALWVKLTSKGPALYWSDRVGLRFEWIPGSSPRMTSFYSVDTVALCSRAFRFYDYRHYPA